MRITKSTAILPCLYSTCIIMFRGFSSQMSGAVLKTKGILGSIAIRRTQQLGSQTRPRNCCVAVPQQSAPPLMSWSARHSALQQSGVSRGLNDSIGARKSESNRGPFPLTSTDLGMPGRHVAVQLLRLLLEYHRLCWRSNHTPQGHTDQSHDPPTTEFSARSALAYTVRCVGSREVDP